MSTPDRYDHRLLRFSPTNIWLAAALYSRYVTGGARTYADWIWIREAS